MLDVTPGMRAIVVCVLAIRRGAFMMASMSNKSRERFESLGKATQSVRGRGHGLAAPPSPREGNGSFVLAFADALRDILEEERRRVA
jgi:hypothetical protein